MKAFCGIDSIKPDFTVSISKVLSYNIKIQLIISIYSINFFKNERKAS